RASCRRIRSPCTPTTASRSASTASARSSITWCNIVAKPTILRRAALTAGVLLAAASASVPAQPAETLKDAYADAFRVGVAVGNFVQSGRDAASLAIVEQHFNSITPENVMKAQPIAPRPGQYNFGPADAFVEFGEARG